MKKLFSFCALLAASVVVAAPVKIIFDTDTLTDYDDVGALAILHAMEDAGEAEILATISCTRSNNSVAVVEIINRYYGRPEIPVACSRGIGVCGGGDGFGLLQKYPGWFQHANSSDAPNSVDVYRKVLAAQPDKSVTICSIGFLTNIRQLLESKPDAYSPLDGKTLMAKKVNRWVAMACAYPKGQEYNSKGDAESSKIAIDQCPVPILFSDFQYGRFVYTGRAVAESAFERNPVKDVFRRMLMPRAKITLKSWDQMTGHPSWDETAVLAAVRGTGKYFGTERGTYKMVGTKGDDVWTASPNGPHERLVETMPKAEVGRVIDELMMRQPKLGGTK